MGIHICSSAYTNLAKPCEWIYQYGERIRFVANLHGNNKAMKKELKFGSFVRYTKTRKTVVVRMDGNKKDSRFSVNQIKPIIYGQ